jgi:hypothetical protein
VGAAAECGAVEGGDQRLGGLEADDPEHLPLAQIERVLDDEARQPLDPFVDHAAVIAAGARSKTASRSRPAP